MKIGVCAEFMRMRAGAAESYIYNLIKSLIEIDKKNKYNR